MCVDNAAADAHPSTITPLTRTHAVAADGPPSLAIGAAARKSWQGCGGAGSAAETLRCALTVVRHGAAGWLAGGGGGIPSGFAKMVSEAEDAGTEKITFTNRVMSFKAKDPQLPYNGIATRY